MATQITKDDLPDIHPDHIPATDVNLDEIAPHGRQRSARNDPEMRDGNSSHGSPGYDTGDEAEGSDRDIGDTAEVVEDEDAEGELLESVPADQEGLPRAANPPAHAGMGATDEAYEAIDARGTTDAGGDDFGDADAEAFEATVGENSPAGPRAGHEASAAATSGADQPSRPLRADGDTRAEAVNDPARTAAKHRHHETPGGRTGNAAEGEPIEGYAELTVAQVLERVETMSADELQAVKAFEEGHRNRKTLLTRLERRLRSTSGDDESGGGQAARSSGTADARKF